MMTENFDNQFNFRTRDWGLLREKLVSDLEGTHSLILATSCSHDEANQLRGRANYIKQLLAIEQTALKQAR